MNIIVLYVNNRPKSIYISTFVSPPNSVGKSKNNLLSNYLMRMRNDTMFDDRFAGQHGFDYFEHNNNENDVGVGVNVGDDNDVDDEIIHLVPGLRNI